MRLSFGDFIIIIVGFLSLGPNERTTDRPNLVPTLAGSAFYECWGFSICCSLCRLVVAYYFLVTNSFSLALAVRAFEGLAMSV